MKSLWLCRGDLYIHKRAREEREERRKKKREKRRDKREIERERERGLNDEVYLLYSTLLFYTHLSPNAPIGS